MVTRPLLCKCARAVCTQCPLHHQTVVILQPSVYLATLRALAQNMICFAESAQAFPACGLDLWNRTFSVDINRR